MSQMLKHVGKVKSTDRRCVVVFMQLPQDPKTALIIDVESLTPRFEQIIREMVESSEGQGVDTFADFMTRRNVPETGRNVLNEFHANGLMRTEPIDNIILVPFPNQPIPLIDVLEAKGTLPDGFKQKQAQEAENFNAVVNNLKAMREEERLTMAQNILFEADLIENEAKLKREEAYRIAPELRPRNAQAKPSVEIATAEGVDAQPKKSGRGGDRRSSTAKAASKAE
jgi:hypothetical protein